MAEQRAPRSELPFFVAELGERLAHDRSAVSAHEFSRLPTIPAGIRTPPASHMESTHSEQSQRVNKLALLAAC